jgi:hypothetical protein
MDGCFGELEASLGVWKSQNRSLGRKITGLCKFLK